jgi:hypothetical protein
MEKSRGRKGTQDYSRAIIRGLEEIRSREGFHTQVSFLRALEEKAGEPVVHPTTYNRWINALRDGRAIERVPATPLMIAADIFGYSLDDLLSRDAGAEEQRGEQARRLDSLQQQIIRLKVIVIHVMRTLIAQRTTKSKGESGPIEITEMMRELELDISSFNATQEPGKERA